MAGDRDKKKNHQAVPKRGPPDRGQNSSKTAVGRARRAGGEGEAARGRGRERGRRQRLAARGGDTLP